MDLPLYYGNSMRSVFCPGDRLQVEEISFDSLQIGDIVTVEGDGNNSNYVHRVIEKTPGYAITMGDDNLHPDMQKLTSESLFMLVSGAWDLRGNYRSVHGGRKGMIAFCYHQRRLHWHMACRRIFDIAEKFFFWRREADIMKHFGADEYYFYKNRPIGRRLADGRLCYASWKMRLFYKMPEAQRDKQ